MWCSCLNWCFSLKIIPSWNWSQRWSLGWGLFGTLKASLKAATDFLNFSQFKNNLSLGWQWWHHLVFQAAGWKNLRPNCDRIRCGYCLGTCWQESFLRMDVMDFSHSVYGLNQWNLCMTSFNLFPCKGGELCDLGRFPPNINCFRTCNHFKMYTSFKLNLKMFLSRLGVTRLLVFQFCYEVANFTPIVFSTIIYLQP